MLVSESTEELKLNKTISRLLRYIYHIMTASTVVAPVWQGVRYRTEGKGRILPSLTTTNTTTTTNTNTKRKMTKAPTSNDCVVACS